MLRHHRTDRVLYVALTAALLSLAGCRADDVYVSPEGDDGNDGAIERPLSTLRAALRRARPGATIYLRGGTHRPTTEQAMGTACNDLYLCAFRLDGNLASERPITICSYPGERASVDLSLFAPADKRACGFLITGDNYVLQDFDIVGTRVTQKGHTSSSAVLIDGGCHSTLRRLRLHDGMGCGVTLREGHDNVVENCDAYNNYDAVSEAHLGIHTHGFCCRSVKSGSTGNVLRGCRSWRNSGNGFDLSGSRVPVRLEHCWAWQNGYDAGMNRRGGGTGFVCGGPRMRQAPPDYEPPRNQLCLCIAWANKEDGFCANHHLGGLDLKECRAMGNRVNFDLVGQRAPNDTTPVPGYGHRLCRCVSYSAGEALVSSLDYAQSSVVDCQLGQDRRLTDADFASLDPDLLRGERRPNGDLPLIAFLQLRPPIEEQARPGDRQ